MSETVAEHTPEGEAAAAAVDQVQHEQAVTEVAVEAAVIASEAASDAATAVEVASAAEADAVTAADTADATAEATAATIEVVEETADVVMTHDQQLAELRSSFSSLHSTLQEIRDRLPEPAAAGPVVEKVEVGSSTKHEARKDASPAESGSRSGSTAESATRGQSARSRRHRFGNR